MSELILLILKILHSAIGGLLALGDFRPWKSWDGDSAAGVWVVYSNGLIFVGKVLDNTFGENVKWSSKKDIVGGGVDNMNLEIKCNRANLEGNVAR